MRDADLARRGPQALQRARQQLLFVVRGDDEGEKGVAATASPRAARLCY
jgi:hypothetical protein